MLFQKDERLEEKLIRQLAQSPNSTARSLLLALNDLGSNYSEQAVYKELAKLQRNYIVVKSRSRYSINLAWATELQTLSEQVLRSHLQSKQSRQLFPDVGTHHTFKFNNLLQMKPFWSHTVLQLVARAQGSELLSWNPHPWFYLVQQEHQQQMLAALEKNNVHLFKIIGGNSYLDRQVVANWRSKNLHFSLSDSPFEKQRTQYFSVVDDFVLEVELSKKMANQIDELYCSINRASDLQVATCVDLFSQRSVVVLRLHNKAERARRIRNKFARVFSSLNRV